MKINITVRNATYEDIPQCLEVEKSAISLHYLNEVKDLFLNAENGRFIVAEIDGRVVGMGNLSICYDGSAWLETLRVMKEEQGKGVGKAIWRRYMEICEELDVPAVRMYTGLSNKVSYGLAQKNGLKTAAVYSEASLDLEGVKPVKTALLERTGAESAISRLSPLKSNWDGYIIFNRTFYSMNEPLYTGLANEGKVYASKNSVMTLGSRFMEKTSLNIGIMDGDLDECLGFAINEGLHRGVPKIVILYPPGRNDIKDTLGRYGFYESAGKLIVMERIFRYNTDEGR